MANLRCLVADKMHESIISMLESAGYTPAYRPNITRSEILDVISEFDGLIIRSKTEINAEIIEKATRLKFIGRAGAGIDQLDVDLLINKGIKILNAPEGNRDALGEHTIGMLLCLFNKIHLADRQVKTGLWDREGNRGVELMGKTVGLIGYGNMGQAFAKRLSSFGCKVLAYDKYVPDFKSDFARASEMATIFEEADMLSFHTPLTPETRGLFDDSYIQQFKKPFYLINTARGEIASFGTIVRGLQSGQLLGAVLDVLEKEKLDQLSPEQKAHFDFLATTDKVLMTPHVAGWTFESYERINEVLISKIKQLGLSF